MRFNNLGEKFSYIAHKFGKNNSIIIGNKKYSFSYLDKNQIYLLIGLCKIILRSEIESAFLQKRN